MSATDPLHRLDRRLAHLPPPRMPSLVFPAPSMDTVDAGRVSLVDPAGVQAGAGRREGQEDTPAHTICATASLRCC